MSNKETKTRVANAYHAMRAIGIEEDKVKPVLKNLMTLFDKNWALIEEENYKVLADAVYDRCKIEAEKCSKKNVNNETDYLEEEAKATEESEPPLERLHRRPQDGQTSCLNTSNASIPRTPPARPNEEPDELSTTQLSQRSTQLSTKYGHMMKLRDRSKGASLQIPSSKKNKAATSALIKPRNEPIVDEMLCLEEPDVIINKVASNRRDIKLDCLVREYCTHKTAALQSVTEKETSEGTATIKESNSQSEFVSGDSLLREDYTHEPAALQSVTEKETSEGTATFKESRNNVTSHKRRRANSTKLNWDSLLREDTHEPAALQSVTEKETYEGTATLKESRNNSELDKRKCPSSLEIASSASGEVKISLRYSLAPGRPCVDAPTLEAVLRSVEDKYLKEPKSLQPKISMTKLMSEICESLVMELPPNINSMSKSSVVDARRLQSGAKVTQPKSIVPSPPLNGINCGPHLDESHASDETVINKENQENCAEESQDVVDIAKGHENVVITLVNDVNDEPPPSFYYIPQNTVFQNAYMNLSLARTGDNNCCDSCSGDCLSSSIPCACSYETGGEYAYTGDGLVKEELLNESISMNRNPDEHCQFFCKECPLARSKRENIIEPCQGHLVRKFIKECWRKCGCNKQCGNRVVQRGITRKLQVFMTLKKGWGLRTLEDLPKGAFVCEYVGEVLTNAELFERVLRSPEGEKRSYPVLLDADWCAEGVLKDEEALCLDATYYGNVARFINHKCHDSNLVEIPVEVETPDHHYYHLAFFTTRKVKAMEELTWDYGIDFDDHEHPIKAFRCQCGSKFCRNVKRSKYNAQTTSLREGNLEVEDDRVDGVLALPLVAIQQSTYITRGIKVTPPLKSSLGDYAL